MSLTNRVLDWWKRLGGKFPETIYWDSVSGQGSQGNTVAIWQTVIDAPVDGSFGPMTDTATKAWQGLHGIDPDGVVGPLTWSAAMKGVGNASTPAVSGPPAGTRPLPQAVANQAAITAFAIETLNNNAITLGNTNRRVINGVDVLARIEPHTWTHRNGVLVKNLNPPIRGVTLYEVIDGSQVAGDSTYTLSHHGCDVNGEFGAYVNGEYRTETDQGGHMAEVGFEVGSRGEHGLPSDMRGKNYRFKR